MNVAIFGIARDIIERVSREATDGAHHGGRADEWATYQEDRRLSAQLPERPVCGDMITGGHIPAPLRF